MGRGQEMAPPEGLTRREGRVSKRIINLTNTEIETLRVFYHQGMLMTDFSTHEEDMVVYKILCAVGAQVDEPVPPDDPPTAS